MESVIRVSPKDDFTLELWFDNGAHRVFDARPYLERHKTKGHPLT
jgi:hypothetical protein